MRSHRTRCQRLLAKEYRELMASRSWWVMLILTGPLVGVSFISAVWTYAEASGLGGTSIGVGQAFSPLVGIWAPTFSAYEIAAVFLLPFVAIRVVAGDRQSGALKLELQQPISPPLRLATKSLVLFFGWLVTLLAALAALGLWMSYGGNAYPPEIFGVALGHFLNAGLTIAFAAAAAAMTEHPSTAAILTFAFTVGTWIVDFIAAVQGGLWEQIAGYTPGAMVAQFQHGLVRLDVVLITLAFIVCGLALASVWIRLGVPVRQRVLESALIVGLTAVCVVSASSINVSHDLSENRQNSFSKNDEAALSQIQTSLRIDAHLAPKDPRRADLERQALAKLRRVMPDVQVHYVSATSIGLFEQTSEHYGEIEYDLGGRKTVNRLTTEEGVLETIFDLADVKPGENEQPVFLGHPLAAPPKGAAIVFYAIWPALIVVSAFLVRRKHT